MRTPGATVTAPERTGRPVLAGTLLVATGLADALAAYGMLRSGTFMVLIRGGLYPVDLTAWAWSQLTVGVAVALAGLVAAVTGRRGAATVAIGGALLAIAVDLLLLPYAPIRVLLVAAVDAAAIRLLLRHRRATRPGGMRPTVSGARRSGP
ncbi:hypothetical protein GCE86_02505 [Micromonospora terminaliae]|uniref:DUF7144 domain-containing protein n=1 Tax=Micromonospora terminaliae TaxID=1914461 RepID=A0AAJ3DIW3_9ACTN|nr:hypothetical protein [Micromonospora terminaliae]NES28234.1 hypothetical protein [Micromonospora terminaliae]QGL46022.1 hypothetical protein GCE86_02505 [Micromonospora terminaliae]